MSEEIQGLKPERIQLELLDLPDWHQIAPGSTTIEWRQPFSSFNRIIEILVDVALFAERFGRTPDISTQGHELTVRLGMNGLTKADLAFAKAISDFF